MTPSTFTCQSCDFPHADVRSYAYVIPDDVPTSWERSGTVSLGTSCGCVRAAVSQGVALSAFCECES